MFVFYYIFLFHAEARRQDREFENKNHEDVGSTSE